MRANPYQDELISAARSGNAEAVKKALAAGADPEYDDSLALRLASTRGHFECVRELIPGSDPKARKSNPLRMAAGIGHVECVRLLIPVSDPKVEDSEILCWAAASGSPECIRLLVPVSDLEVARRKLHKEGRHEALTLLDSVLHEDELKAKHLDRHVPASRRAI